MRYPRPAKRPNPTGRRASKRPLAFRHISKEYKARINPLTRVIEFVPVKGKTLVTPNVEKVSEQKTAD